MQLRQVWLDLKASLWFIPGICVLAAVGLAIALIAAEPLVGEYARQRWPLLLGSGADGARGLLSTVASSMITVVGVVFSITIVALSLASSQYTSRVLRNFTSDRMNQTVLGVFVGVFAYCLIVLRTIRGGDEGAFVPSVAVLFGLILAFVGIGVLIFFIHHISASIQATHILAGISSETIRAMDHLFPDPLAGGEMDVVATGDQAEEVWWHSIASVSSGYFQSVDIPGLVAFAAGRDCVIRLERDVGQFVVEGMAWASVSGIKAPDAEELEQLRSFYAVGLQRTVEQDAVFGIRQIVDVALKALSPGVNDTTTAVMCVDYLTAILFWLSRRRIESGHREPGGIVRVLASGPTYSSLVRASLDQIRQNASGNIAVLEALLECLEVLASATFSAPRLRVLHEQAEALAEVAHRTIPAAQERERVHDRAARLVRRVEAGVPGVALAPPA